MKTLAAFLLISICASAQVAATANSGYKTKEGRANVAARLTAADRDARQKPLELVEALEIKPGATVADVGTGAGYLLPWLARAAGPGGRVLAQDIHEDFLDQAKERAAREKLTNVSFLLGTDRDPKLPAGAVDLALALDSYHHYDYPAEMLAALRQSLRNGGRLAIVEYYKRPGAMNGSDAVAHIRLDRDDLIREVEANGFQLITTREHIPNSQYLAIFRVR